MTVILVHPGVAHEIILSHWSKNVMDDFNSANPDIVKVTTDGAQAVAVINQQS